MGDSTTAADIPASFDMVAGYCDGIYKWSDADWLRFPDKVKVRIAIHASTLGGSVLDVEWGAAAPADIPAWLTARRAAGADPSVYVNRSNWQAAKDACAAAGVAEPHWWLAAYGTAPTVDSGLVAKQYANEALTGGHYDASVVADFWPGVDDMAIDRARYAAEIEPFVKETMRVMLEQDPASIAAIEKAATDDTALRKVLTVVGDELTKAGTR